MIFHSYVSLPEGKNRENFIATFDSRNKFFNGSAYLHHPNFSSPKSSWWRPRSRAAVNSPKLPSESSWNLGQPHWWHPQPSDAPVFYLVCHLKIGYPLVPLNTWCFLIILSLSIKTLPCSYGKYPISYAISHYTPIISPVIVGPVFMLLIQYIITYWFYIPWRRVTINYLVWYHSKPMFNANIIHFKWL